MRRSLLLSVVTAVLFLPLAAGAVSLSVMIDGELTVFSDVPEDAWFSLYVKQAAEAGIVGGYKDAEGNLTGKFGPGDAVTRAQTLKIAIEGAGYDVAAYAAADSGPKRNHWADDYLSVAVMEGGWVNRATVQLDVPITRAEVAVLIARAFRVDLGYTGSSYNDVKEDTLFATEIESLTRDGVISGDTDADGNPIGRFRPTDFINRAETVKIVMRAREVYGEPGIEEGSMEESGEASNIITYTYEGFSPSVLYVKKGAKILFRNGSLGQMWIASDPHPDHTNLEFLDAGRGYDPDETYEFDFLQEESWGFHNHLNSQHRAMIIVE